MKSIKLDSFGVKAIVTKTFAKKKRIINFSKWILSQDFQKQSSRSVLLFTGKQLCQSLFFKKVAGLRPATLLKKRLWRRCFSVNVVKFLRTPFYMQHLWWLFLGFTSNIFELHEPKTGGKRKA